MSRLIVARSNRGAPDPIGLHDSGENLINPAVKEKQEEIITKLTQAITLLSDIDTNTDELELKADTVILNTDELEAKITEVRDAVGTASGTDLLTQVQGILGQLDVALSTRATETTLIQIRDYLDTVETKLQLLIDKPIQVKNKSGSNTDVGWRKPDENLPVILTDKAKREAQISAFGLLKVANEAHIKAYKFTQSLVNVHFSQILTASGTWGITDHALDLRTGASINSGTRLTTKAVHPYTIGRGQLLKMSIILGDSGVAGNTREWGLFDDDNGVFVRLNGTSYEFIIKNKGNETIILASNWDIPVSPDQNGHLWYIQYQWLGVGNIYLYYDEQLVHTYNFIGTSTEASFADPDLPVRFNNQNSTNNTDIYLRCNGASVSQEGTEKTILTDGETDATISPEHELCIKPPSQRLFDYHFGGSSVNSDVWQDAIVGSGSINVADSFYDLDVTTANGDSAEIYSLQSFQHIFSQTYSFRCGVVLDEESLNNNTRIWGMRNISTNDGWYFRLQNGVLEVVTEFNGAITAVSIDSYKPTDGQIHRYDTIYRNYRILFFIDGTLVYKAASTLNPLYKEEYLNLYFRNYNTGVTASGATLSIEGVAVFDDSKSSTEISGVDPSGLIRKVAVTTTGRLLVSQEPPTAPPATTEVNEGGQVSVAKQGATNEYNWVIPSGETVIVQRFEAGGYVPKDGNYLLQSKIELWHQPNGTPVGEELIAVIYLQHMSDNFRDLNRQFTGDGTARIQMRITNWSVEDAEFTRIFRGYY